MKMDIKKFIIALFLGCLVISCTNEDLDDEYPVIDASFEQTFPQNCDTLYRGEAFQMQARFTDNKELGAYNIDIHNNFDHHSHSTEVTQCELDPEKEPTDDVFLFISESLEIPEGLTSYVATYEIDIPANVDTGDYHFFLTVTDRRGWETRRGLSIKILDRE